MEKLIQNNFDKIERSQNEIRSLIKSVKDAPNKDVIKKKAQKEFNNIESNLKKVHQILAQMDSDSKSKYQDRVKELDRISKRLNQSLQEAVESKSEPKTKKKNQRVVEDSDDSDDDIDYKKPTTAQEQIQSVALLRETNDIQQDSKRIVNAMESQSEQMIKMAEDILMKLEAQTEQMERIQDELNKMGGALKRAQRETTHFMRKLLAGKLIRIVIAIIILLCIAFLVIRMIPGVNNVFNISWGSNPPPPNSSGSE